MLSAHEHITIEEASEALLRYVLEPRNWLLLSSDVGEERASRPGQNPAYQRRVGALKICASVEVNAALDTTLRISFRGPGLAPLRAADHLELFLKRRIPFVPNAEWELETGARHWIHFTRRYTPAALQG